MSDATLATITKAGLRRRGRNDRLPVWRTG